MGGAFLLGKCRRRNFSCLTNDYEIHLPKLEGIALLSTRAAKYEVANGCLTQTMVRLIEPSLDRAELSARLGEPGPDPNPTKKQSARAETRSGGPERSSHTAQSADSTGWRADLAAPRPDLATLRRQRKPTEIDSTGVEPALTALNRNSAAQSPIESTPNIPPTKHLRGIKVHAATFGTQGGNFPRDGPGKFLHVPALSAPPGKRFGILKRS